MGDGKRKKVEYRYFEMPPHTYAIGILGDLGRPFGGKGQPEDEKEQFHLHNYMEVGYCCGGEGELVVGEERLRIPKNTVFMVPPQCPHRVLGLHENTKWGFVMADAAGLLHDMLGPGQEVFAREIEGLVYGGHLILERREHEKLEFITARLFQELQSREEYYGESVKGLLLTLVMEIARINGDRAAFWGRKEEGRELIAPALDFIHENCRHPIRICDLARLCCISETHFRRLFGEVMNLPPARYVNLVRIFTACEFLRKSDYSIREIGIMTGFSTLSTFQRNFKSQTGVSPRVWRSHPEKLGLHEFSEKWSELHSLQANLKTRSPTEIV